jgi:hypothetical protein
MKKKLTGLIIAGIAVFALSGCGGGTEVVYVEDVDDGPELVTLFLIDQDYYGIDHVPYTCIDAFDEVITNDFTTIDGEFTFAVGDRCEFDLFGLPNIDSGSLYIVDIDDLGKDDIPYNCINDFDEFTEGTTDFDGWFAYPDDAYCKFYF